MRRLRIARTYTGRTHVVACGYFGWHDWSSDAAGVPASTKGDVTRVAKETVEALRVIKVYNAEQYQSRMFESVNERNRRSHMRLVLIALGKKSEAAMHSKARLKRLRPDSAERFVGIGFEEEKRQK